MMQKTSGISIALDNCSAVEIIDDKYRIIHSNSKAKAYRVFWNKGKYIEEEIEQRKDFVQIFDLLKK